jgi:hypothetical protein
VNEQLAEGEIDTASGKFDDPEFSPKGVVSRNTDNHSAIVSADPGSWITSLVGQGADPAKLTQLYDLYERYNRDQAVKAYNEAMQRAQAEMPTIVCDCTNPQTRSKYPSVEAINRGCKPIYTRNGFALSFGEGKADVEGFVRTTCTVMHSGGHSKEFFIDLPSDGTGIKGNSNMTAIHGRLSSKTYAQSKQLREIFNLTVADVGDDTDGNKQNEALDEDQMERLNTLLEDTGHFVDEGKLKRFLKWCNDACIRLGLGNVEKVSDIGTEFWQTAVNALENDKKKKAGAR